MGEGLSRNYTSPSGYGVWGFNELEPTDLLHVSAEPELESEQTMVV